MLHVVRKCFDLLRPGGEPSGPLSQTPQELEPSDGKRKEAAMVGQSEFNLGESQSLSASASQHKCVCNRKQITGVVLQALPGITLVCEMSQEGKTFL